MKKCESVASSSDSPSSRDSLNRDWFQVFSVYGVGEAKTLTLLLIHATFFSSLSLLSLLYSHHRLLSVSSPSIFVSAATSFTVLAIYLLYAAVCVARSSLGLHWAMCARVVATVPDWSSINATLVVGCGRGVLVNSVSMQLKKCDGSGRVVGLDHRKETAVDALRTAVVEGVEKYVTCREADARSLPFSDRYFDVVVSAVHLSWLGKEAMLGTFGMVPTKKEEREKALREIVRALRPGGVGVVWDLVCVPEYVKKLVELGMENVEMSENVTAYMVCSHIVSFKKPLKESMVAKRQGCFTEIQAHNPSLRIIN